MGDIRDGINAKTKKIQPGTKDMTSNSCFYEGIGSII